MNKNIAIIMNAYVLYESPTIFNICSYLKEKKCEVTIFIDELKRNKYNLKEDPYEVLGINIKVYEEYKNSKKDKLYSLLLGKVYSRLFLFLVKFLKYLFSTKKKQDDYNFLIGCLTRISPYYHKIKKYASFINCNISTFDYLIFVEPEAFIINYYTKTKKKFAYLSLELNNLPKYEFDYIDITKRHFLKKEISKAEFVIIQDKARRDVFKKCYSVSTQMQFFFLPVSLREEINKAKSYYLYKKFSIPKNKKIVLYAGSIVYWACVKELVKSMKNWDEKFVFVIHGGRYDVEYLKDIEQMANGNNNIYISREWLPFDELNDLISSAFCAFAVYQNSTENYSLTTFASGKLASYFRNGIPVIGYNFKELNDFVNKYKCGAVFKDYKSIGEILNMIEKKHDLFKENALNTYEKFYYFDNYFHKIYAEIK